MWWCICIQIDRLWINTLYFMYLLVFDVAQRNKYTNIYTYIYR
jgi:hypothetical protein